MSRGEPDTRPSPPPHDISYRLCGPRPRRRSLSFFKPDVIAKSAGPINTSQTMNRTCHPNRRAASIRQPSRHDATSGRSESIGAGQRRPNQVHHTHLRPRHTPSCPSMTKITVPPCSRSKPRGGATPETRGPRTNQPPRIRPKTEKKQLMVSLCPRRETAADKQKARAAEGEKSNLRCVSESSAGSLSDCCSLEHDADLDET
ncbi:hypothetical protein VDGL01_06476 [Verticillium dahliae]